MARILWTLFFALAPSYLLVTLHGFLYSKITVTDLGNYIHLLSFAESMLCMLIGATLGLLIVCYRCYAHEVDIEFESRFPLMLAMTHVFRFLMDKRIRNLPVTATEIQVYGGGASICCWLHLYAKNDVWHNLFLCWSFVDWLRCTYTYLFFQGKTFPKELVPLVGELYGALLILPVLAYVNTQGHPDPWVFMYIVIVAGIIAPRLKVELRDEEDLPLPKFHVTTSMLLTDPKIGLLTNGPSENGGATITSIEAELEEEEESYDDAMEEEEATRIPAVKPTVILSGPARTETISAPKILHLQPSVRVAYSETLLYQSEQATPPSPPPPLVFGTQERQSKEEDEKSAVEASRPVRTTSPPIPIPQKVKRKRLRQGKTMAKRQSSSGMIIDSACD